MQLLVVSTFWYATSDVAVLVSIYSQDEFSHVLILAMDCFYLVVVSYSLFEVARKISFVRKQRSLIF